MKRVSSEGKFSDLSAVGVCKPSVWDRDTSVVFKICSFGRPGVKRENMGDNITLQYRNSFFFFLALERY